MLTNPLSCLLVRHQLTDSPVPPAHGTDTLIPIDSPYSTAGHRDQDKIGPIASMKKKIFKESDGDRQGLVSKELSDDEDPAFGYTREYMDDNDDEVTGLRRGL
jgi:hypothetical protein